MTEVSGSEPLLKGFCEFSDSCQAASANLSLQIRYAKRMPENEMMRLGAVSGLQLTAFRPQVTHLRYIPDR